MTFSSLTGCLTLNAGMIQNKELERMQRDAVVVYGEGAESSQSESSVTRNINQEAYFRIEFVCLCII
jgi:uncharacterized OsmC-like protein